MRRIPDILLAVLLTLATPAIGQTIGPNDQPSQAPAQQETENKKEGHSQRSGVWDWIVHDAAGFFTAWLVIVGGLQLVLFAWQLWIIRRSMDDAKTAALAAKESADSSKLQAETARGTLDTMQDTAQRQLRAYVCVEAAIRTKNPGELEGTRFAACVTVKNYGETPAYDLYQWAMLDLREFPLNSPLNIYCNSSRSRAILPPGHKTMAFPVFNREFTGLEEQAILADGRAIYAYGEVSYRDVFGKTRLTQFRLRCNGQGYLLGLFKADGEGNEAD